MNNDNRYALLRNKLDAMGFTQPLPIGALSIVSAILDDLVLTTNSLKHAKAEIGQLQEEKSAWELGVEPLKCDNSKLLAECNSLHTEINHQRDEFQSKLLQMKKTIRNLELDNRTMEEHCAELNQRLYELQQFDSNDPKSKKNKNDQINFNRKPFISTVRTGVFLPPTLKVGDTEGSGSCSRCSSATSRSKILNLDVERERNHAKEMMELAELYKSQLASKEREISRLNKLLIGGRPSSALAKDCCYRGVGSLTEDIEILQKEKSQMQMQLENCIRHQHEAMERAMALNEQNKKLTDKLNNIEEVALSVETEANNSLSTLHKQNVKLKARVNSHQLHITQLEDKLRLLDDVKEALPDVTTLKSALKEAKLENKVLRGKLEMFCNKGEDWRNEKDKLLKKYSHVRGKLSVLEKCPRAMASSPQPQINQHDPHDYNPKCIVDLEGENSRLRSDRDYYQKEYLRLISQTKNDAELDALRNQLSDKQYEVTMLKQQLSNSMHSPDPMSARSVQSVIHRSERETEILRQNLQRLKDERDTLRENLRTVTESRNSLQEKYEEQVLDLNERIAQLENENCNLQTVQGPSKNSISLLKDELTQAKAENRNLISEISKLRTTNSQLKILQEQTENALVEHQSRLSQSETQRFHAESRLGMADTNRTQVCQEIGELKADIVILRTNNSSLEKEKEKLVSELERKTERLYQLEAKLDKFKSHNMDLETQVAMSNRQLEEVNSVRKQKDGTLEQMTNETDLLRKQIQQLKRTSENALTENSRLARELTDLECDQCVTKTKLTEAEKEVARLKNQLQQYVQEVERAEDLLLRKEHEREEMLDHFRSLSQDAVILEGTNSSLEAEAAETKRNLVTVESKMTDLHKQLKIREKELSASKLQVSNLMSQVSALETEHAQCNHDKATLRKELAANKEICNKLDIEKEKLNAEVSEYFDIRRELERENEKLRNDMLQSKFSDKAALENLQHLLTTCREDLEQQRLQNSEASKEITKLRGRVEELQTKWSDEHANAIRNETLAKEYSLQIQELRNRLTDDRFLQVQSKDKDDSVDRFSTL